MVNAVALARVGSTTPQSLKVISAATLICVSFGSAYAAAKLAASLTVVAPAGADPNATSSPEIRPTIPTTDTTRRRSLK
jgi:hypothetical protein